jgi:uncharacterized protein YggU (UPF0235/DUF167 family)
MYVKVHVYPGMKKEKITETTINTYELILKAPAERNAANVRVREIIADIYCVPITAVRIITGHHSPSKILDVTRDISK